jgi:putative ABC transport system permease protein
MHILPILHTLRRHRTAASLIVLEIALTCAIVCNAVFVIRERLGRMDRPSGLVEDELIRLQVASIGVNDDAAAITLQDFAAIRALPGVKAVATSNMIPFGNSSWNSDASPIKDDPNGVNTAMYMGSPELLETFGVRLIAGRDFTPDEYVELKAAQQNKAKIGSTIITKGVADRFWPGDNAVGKKLYVWGDDPQTVVGVVERIARPNEAGDGASYGEMAMFMPVDTPFNVGGNYLIRIDPTYRDSLLAAIESTMTRVHANRIFLEKQTFAEVRTKYFRKDRSMAYLLVGVSVALLIITALGVIGLASFWVQQRTRQIGVRRALGATKRDIVHYFQLENFILATIGIVLGMVLAYGINLWLMDTYGVARLPAEFLPVGALLLWLLGQVAVLGPALRAAGIPPAIATRSV